MASFDKYSNYSENMGFSSIVFGSEKPVLEVELNEMQQIINSKFSRLFKMLGTCVVPISDEPFVVENISSTESNLNIPELIVLEDSGYSFYVKPLTISLDLDSPYVYFKVEEVTLDFNSTINEYGYENGAIISNSIKDVRSPMETTKRKAIRYSILIGSSIPENKDNVKYIPLCLWDLEDSVSLLSTSRFEKLETYSLNSLQDSDVYLKDDGSVEEITSNYNATTEIIDESTIKETFTFKDGTKKVRTTTISEDGKHIKQEVE